MAALSVWLQLYPLSGVLVLLCFPHPEWGCRLKEKLGRSILAITERQVLLMLQRLSSGSVLSSLKHEERDPAQLEILST